MANVQSIKKTTAEMLRRRKAESEAYRSPYERWKESQGLATIRGFQVDNVYTVELNSWEARGGSGVFINLDGADGFNDSYVYELPPMQSSTPIKHIYDELVFILRGKGATTVWNDVKKKQTFEWGEGSMFAIPPNSWHQHHNASGTEPIRYFAMTAAPRVIDTFQNLDFVFNNSHVFTDRFNDEAGYFNQNSDRSGSTWVTNFISDVMAVMRSGESSEEEIEERARAGIMGSRGGVGGGGAGGRAAMVNATVRCGIGGGTHPGLHEAAHRHGPGIHVLTLGGHGYSYLWPDGAEPQRVEWGPGTIFAPPELWWHSHFVTGPGRRYHLRIGWGTDKPKVGGREYVYSSLKEGGDQIALDEEDPRFHREFEAELAKSGQKCLMLHHPYCTFK